MNARDRIGSHGRSGGENLHSDQNKLSIDEKGEGERPWGHPNRHDILRLERRRSDMTCGNWTSNGEGSARSRPQRWRRASHRGIRSCSQQDLIGTGGNGLFYCFVRVSLYLNPFSVGY